MFSSLDTFPSTDLFELGGGGGHTQQHPGFRSTNTSLALRCSLQLPTLIKIWRYPGIQKQLNILPRSASSTGAYVSTWSQ
jgi:hypothetical protein